jgi:cytochrome c oxidase cbb3-type subunit 2
MAHETIEKNIGLMAVLILVVISLGGLTQIVPLMFKATIVEPAEGVEPYSPIELAGRDVYISEGCYGCHSQQIRPFRSETERYGHYSVAGEFVYDRPFQWGSKRTGPDLARVGGKYSRRLARTAPDGSAGGRPDSNMPAYPWLARKRGRSGRPSRPACAHSSGSATPYSDEQIAAAAQDDLVGDRDAGGHRLPAGSRAGLDRPAHAPAVAGGSQ